MDLLSDHSPNTHTRMHTHIHTYTHAYTHTHTHTYICPHRNNFKKTGTANIIPSVIFIYCVMMQY